jgi:hypothetical protein
MMFLSSRVSVDRRRAAELDALVALAEFTRDYDLDAAYRLIRATTRGTNLSGPLADVLLDWDSLLARLLAGYFATRPKASGPS